MDKDLSQLSLEELWRLFPIFLVAPKPQWETNYQEMEVRLEQVLGDLPLVRISHIGSTAIPGIWAKDIVDVLVELAPQADFSLASERLVQSGFLKMSESLKLALWSQYEHNRDAYTDAKTDFIQTWTRQARQEYGARYDKGKTD